MIMYSSHTVDSSPGAFIGMACVDYSGYDQTAEFRSFDYKELD